MRRAAPVAIGAVLAAASASALEPPTTAQSLATSVPMLLLDDGANTFAFPSLSAGLEPAVFAYGAAGLEEYRLSADSGIRLAGGLGSLWYQSAKRPTNAASRTTNQFRSAHSQAGWSREVGAARLGASFTWSTSAVRRREFDTEEFVDRRSEYYRTDFDAVDIREASIGAGWTGGIELDAVLDLAKESFHHETLSRSYRVLPGDERLTRVMLRETIDTGLRLGGGVRLALPLGPRTRLRAAGTWRDTGNDFERELIDQLIHNGRLAAEEREELTSGGGGDELAAGIRLERTAAEGAPSWGVHAWYERIRGGWRYEWGRPEYRRYQTRRDHLLLGCSVQHPGPAGLEFLGGIAILGERNRDREERGFDREGVARELSGDREDFLDFSLSWGARRQFDKVELIASFRDTPPLTDLIAALDIRVPF